jgi:hypothetical protein
VDNFTDSSCDVIWSAEEKEERERTKLAYGREVQELER